MKLVIATLGLTLFASAWAQTTNNQQRQGPPQGGGNGPGGQTAEESFKKRDTNNDGFLSKAEIAGSRLEANFDKLDTNHDGKLSLAEYKAGREAMQGQGPQGFQGTPGQGQGMGGDRSQMRGQMAEQRFKELDKNNDGFLSKAEVAGSRMADRFDQMDTNHDGKLSLNELKAGMQNMGPGQGPNGAQGMGGAAPASTSKKSTT